MSKSRVKVVDMGLARRLAELQRLGAAGVEVGIPQDAGSEDGASLADIGAYMEYGTQDIPARPWLTQGVAQARPGRLLLIAARDVATGKRDAYVALERLGLEVVGVIQERMTQIQPPLKPATIAAKGSDKPLVDTGRLRQSVAHRVLKDARKER